MKKKTDARMYVAFVLRKWSDINAVRLDLSPIQFVMDCEDDSIGFLPVFRTLRALRKAYPKSDYVTIEPKPK